MQRIVYISKILVAVFVVGLLATFRADVSPAFAESNERSVDVSDNGKKYKNDAKSPNAANDAAGKNRDGVNTDNRGKNQRGGDKITRYESKEMSARLDSIASQLDTLQYATSQLSDRLYELQIKVDNNAKKQRSEISEPVKERRGEAKYLAHNKVKSDKDYILDNVDKQIAEQKAKSDKSLLGEKTAAGMSAYKKAYKAMQDTIYDGNKNFSAVRKIFRKFISDFPGNAMMGSAYYWIAETYMYEGNYENAAMHYLKGYEAPISERSPDNLMGLAQALIKLNKIEGACSVISQLQKEFRDIGKDMSDRARNIFTRIGCE